MSLIFYVCCLCVFVLSIYYLYLTLSALEVRAKKDGYLHELLIFSGWWPLKKDCVPEKHNSLIKKGRILLILIITFAGIVILIAP